VQGNLTVTDKVVKPARSRVMSYARQINLRDRNKQALIELAILSFELRVAFLNTQNFTLATLPLNSAHKFSDNPTNFLTHN
jgi:hypothetical protein